MAANANVLLCGHGRAGVTSGARGSSVCERFKTCQPDERKSLTVLERAACTRPRSPLGGDDGRVGQELPGIGALRGLLRLLLPRLLLGLRALQLLLPLLFG